MSKQLGLWIDHRRATIVTATENGEETREILSDAEKQPRRAGDSPLKGPMMPFKYLAMPVVRGR